jgi:subtilisin family serine protease
MKHDKLTPRLSIVYDAYSDLGREGLRRRARLLNLVSVAEMPKPPRAVVFLYCDEDTDLSRLDELGVEVNQRSGRIRTAIAPIDTLDPLSEQPGVSRIASSHYLRPLMDVAPGRVGVPQFRQVFPQLNGEGVVFGLVDSGIDPNHPAFTGRIARIWDQTLPGAGVPEGGYGAELSNSTLTTSRDTHGHGTHVSGIAAGDDAVFGGIAPRATLVVVKTDFSDVHIADGIRYIFRVANDLDLPAVINLSLGGHSDAHDGSDALSQVIDEVSGPGRIVCCAAGNEGNDNIHAQVSLAQGGTASAYCSVPSGAVTAGSFLLNGWYSGADELEVAVASPGGLQTAFQPLLSGQSPVGTFDLPNGRVTIVTPSALRENGDHQFLVLVELALASGNPPLASRPWRLRLRGAQVTDDAGSRVDIWILDETEGLGATFSGRAVQDSVKVGSPGAAASAITVAAFTTKVQWTNIDGQSEQVSLELDDISDFTSEGPGRDGSEKPDIAAPGAMIASCLSVDASIGRRSIIDARHVVMAGTSMATPFISGLVALLLQANRGLTPDNVRQRLRDQSRIPRQLAGTFDPKWGYGLLNAGNLQP